LPFWSRKRTNEHSRMFSGHRLRQQEQGKVLPSSLWAERLLSVFFRRPRPEEGSGRQASATARTAGSRTITRRTARPQERRQRCPQGLVGAPQRVRAPPLGFLREPEGQSCDRA